MFSILVLFAASAGAATPAAAPAGQEDPLVCTRVKVGDEVGTHMVTKKKVCMRKSERDFIDQHEKQSVQQLINDGNDRMRFIPVPRAPR